MTKQLSTASEDDDNDTRSSSSPLALPPLTERLRKSTRSIHDKSDKLVNLKLAMVLTSKPLYAEAISLFWPIYEELESLMEKQSDHPQLKLFQPLLPILRRGSNFQKDMLFLLNNNQTTFEELKNRRRIPNDKEEKIEPTTNSNSTFSPPELEDYINHLRYLSESNPILLLAYVSAMYGAIMAGGSIIKRTVQSAFGLSKNSDQGVETFVVDLTNTEYKNILEFRNDMKRIINTEIASQLSEEVQQLIIEEASYVFVRNNALVATVKNTSTFNDAWDQLCKKFSGFVIVMTCIVVTITAIIVKEKYQ